MEEGAPIFGGAKGPRTFFGIDVRLVPVLMLLTIGAALASFGGIVPVIIILAVTVIVFAIARVLAAKSPLLLDEIAQAVWLRWGAPNAIPDDNYAQHPEGWKAWR